jgi:hypothetical protein
VVLCVLSTFCPNNAQTVPGFGRSGLATIIESEMQRGIWRDRAESESTTLGEALTRYAEEIIPSRKSPGPDIARLYQWQARPIAKSFMASIRGKDVAVVIRGMEALSNPVELVGKPRLPRGRDRRLVGDLQSHESRTGGHCDRRY